MESCKVSSSSPHQNARFATTRWSLVAAAGLAEPSSRQNALAELCQRYWPPLYAFLRQQGYSRHDAKDLTQSFILDLLSKNTWEVADPERGRFRSFLLGCLKHFLSHERDKQQAKKRGGSKLTFSMYQVEGEDAYQAVSKEPSPEKLFEQAWLNTVLKRVVQRFLEPCKSAPDQAHMVKLMPSILGAAPDYARLAEEHQKTPAAMRQMISRLRKKYQELLLEEIAETVHQPSDVHEEIQYLFHIASKKG